MQNAALTTQFNFGPKLLEPVGRQVAGVPVRSLPEGTVHYYMSEDQVSVVFEVPAGNGRILFVGFDYSQIVPHWADVLLLAESELLKGN
mmetsp:Transcript_58401/g.143250  ORF Transcript_58401/g.143250 Transcript_58401/m.143250 type:complete len:89 (+) Transcript_58401:356-622(+)